MASFTFYKKHLKAVRVGIDSFDNSVVWFQPCHGGGCLQVLSGDKYVNTFCKQRTGYRDLCDKTILINVATQLAPDWLDMILADRVMFARFCVNLKKNKKFQVNLTVRRAKI